MSLETNLQFKYQLNNIRIIALATAREIEPQDKYMLLLNKEALDLLWPSSVGKKVHFYSKFLMSNYGNIKTSHIPPYIIKAFIDSNLKGGVIEFKIYSYI